MSNLSQLDSPQDAAMLLTIVRSETARSQVYHRSGLSLARRRLNMQQATESQVLLELDRRRAL